MSSEWITKPPTMCDLCGARIIDRFVDGQTSIGAWAIMCDHCHKAYGKGLGEGLGQLYQKAANGRWPKTQG